MKILFLDHDGVMCLSTEWGSRHTKQAKAKLSGTPMKELPVEVRFDNFNKKAVRTLNQILEVTGAEIVTSSDWRFHCTVEEMQAFFKTQGVSKSPIGFTDSLAKCQPELWKKIENFAQLELERALEVKNWLDNHPEVTHWVAVDDLDMSKTILGADGLENFVKTPSSDEGIKQCGVSDKIVKFLNK
jgi:hypothetical protein